MSASSSSYCSVSLAGSKGANVWMFETSSRCSTSVKEIPTDDQTAEDSPVGTTTLSTSNWFAIMGRWSGPAPP